MAYTTVDAWQTTYPRLASTKQSSATLYAWVARASNLVDAYIKDVVGTVPVSPTPPLLTMLTEDLAYSMFLKRNVHEASKEGAIAEMWKESINTLENIKNGVISLVDTNGAEITTTNRSSSPWSDVVDYTPTFGKSDIDDAVVDEDLVDAEADARE